MWVNSPVAQLVERLTVNEAATYGGEVDVSRMAELTPQLVSRSETCGVNSWQLPRETVVDTAGELREAYPEPAYVC